ncbi:MAG: S-layer homology domain-containing protein [Ruminiclostridium sp.]|nr:S-layer homology domain-containing protein [Ruminiclostridium sp.]
MKRGRTILVVGLILSLMASMATISSALPKAAAQQDKVLLLSELKVFTGYNGDYRLNDKLSRSEAAALAVRMLGKETHVLLNATNYSMTSFPDVDASSWYAPYVGYCTKEGILLGNTDGKYKPNDFITEKAFIKIILGVLGYEFNKDYTWVNLYKKAFETGLVTEISYIVKEEDNTEFKRGDAVNIMYNALGLDNIKTNKALFYTLITEGVLTTEKAVQLKLIEDEKITEIEELLVFDQNNITILFNENINAIDKIKIYQVNNESKELAFSIDEMHDNYIMLKTEKQTPGMEYTVEVHKVEDTNKNIQEALYTAFIGFMQQTVESDFFRINKIEPLNEKSIKLFFTHPVNINSENPLYYSISNENYTIASGEKDQLLAKTITSEDHCVLLSLKTGSFSEGEQYRVDIKGYMTSAYAARLNNGDGDEMAFTAIAGQADGFKVLEVIPYENDTILLSFNKEVNPFLAKQIFNYYVTDKDLKPIAIESATVEEQGLRIGEVVYLKLSKNLQKDAKYYVTINNLNDVTKQEYITELTYSLIADYGSVDNLSIVDITPIDRQTIDVYFSNMLDPGTAEIISFYSISLRNGTSTVYPKGVLYDTNIHPYKVTLFFNNNDLEVKREYELKVNFDMKDYLGNKAGTTLRKVFNASDVDKTNPNLKEVKPVSTNTVKLVFDKQLAFTQTNLLPNNYTLEYNYQGMNIRKAPLSVLYINAKTIVLMFDDLEYEVPYTLRVNTIVDFSGTAYKVTGEGTNYKNFILEKQEP